MQLAHPTCATIENIPKATVQEFVYHLPPWLKLQDLVAVFEVEDDPSDPVYASLVVTRDKIVMRLASNWFATDAAARDFMDGESSKGDRT